MKTNGKSEVIARIARQSLVLATLFAMLLLAADISRAQSSATSPATPTAKMAAPSAAKPVRPAAKLPAKSPHEGITVHGHWTIDVKNPDGTVASHHTVAGGTGKYTGITGNWVGTRRSLRSPVEGQVVAVIVYKGSYKLP